MPKGCLRLEVTESLVMENPEQAIEILDWLKGLGAGIALDEFGAGYSSLAYLHRLAVDTIKIDRSLISHGSDNKSGAVVLRAAMAMARELGKDVIAVGMEREEDVAYVRALGCDYAQGLYFGEPMTEREVMNLLNALAKSVRRDERREKKKKKLDDPVMTPPGSEGVKLQAETQQPLMPQQPGTGRVYALPVPVSQPAAAKAKAVRWRQKRGEMLTSLRKRLQSVTSSGGTLTGKLGSLFKSKPKPQPQAKKSRQPRPGQPPVPREAQSLRGRLAQVDASPVDPRTRHPAPPPPAPPPQAGPLSGPPRTAEPPRQPAGTGFPGDAPPDLRRRRG